MPVWGGWRVVSDGAKITWRGGLMGVHTTIGGRGPKLRREGLLRAEEIRSLLE
jgi:hypothetical protein